MPTTVVKTIGTSSRDYSTLQAWEDACPANLVTSDQIWRGECYNDSEFVDSSGNVFLAISGETTDATRYLELTAAAGQSFQDNAGVRTNALKYNASNGVGIRETTGYNAIIFISVNFARFSRIQMKHDGTGRCITSSGGDSCTLKDTILYTTSSNTGIQIGSSWKIINVLSFNSSTGGGLEVFAGNLIIGCAVIRTTDQSATGTAYINSYNGNTLKSSCCFGFSTVTTGSWNAASGNNATDLASGLPGTSNQHSVTFNSTTPFADSTVAAQDSKSIAATALAANGFLDATNAPNDITGTARSATPTIGVWELAGAPPPPDASPVQRLRRVYYV